jgi:preprotein translocase subunit SecE
MARVSSRRTPPPVSPRSVGKVSPVTFLQEVVSELRKSVWPSREETARLTVVVIVLALIMGFYLGGFDRLFAVGLQRLFGLF